MHSDRTTSSWPISRTPRRRGIRSLLPGLVALSLSCAGGLVAASPIAFAEASTETVATEKYNVVDRPADGVTADSLPTVQIDRGIVRKQVFRGDTVYVGGEFQNARPAGAAPGTHLVPRSNLMSYDVTTGVMTGWNPQVNGPVTSLAVSPDGTRLYIGGTFTTVDGQPRSNVAAFDTATGQLVAGWAPQANAAVESITVTEQAVHLGGAFTTVSGLVRRHLAAVTPAGQLTAWAPSLDGTVTGIEVMGDGTMVIGGSFAYVNGVRATGTAKVSLTNGTMLPWAASSIFTNAGSQAGIYSISRDGNDILATAWKYNSDGNFEGVVRLDGSTGKVVWMADCHGDSYGAVALGDTVYSVSHHHNCEAMGNFGDQGVFERAQAFTDRATTTTQHSTGGSYYTDWAGQPAPSQVAWAPQLEAGTFTQMDQAAWNVNTDGRYLVLGGEFPTVNGQNQQGIARFTTADRAPKKAAPALWGQDWQATTTAVGSQVRVNIPVNHDLDGLNLTYEIHRTDQTAPVHTIKADSVWWTKANLAWTDTTTEPWSHYDYYVVAVDADGNTQRSATAGVTTGARIDTSYGDRLLADGATHLWRLDDPAGSTQSIDLAGANNMVNNGGVGPGAPGVLAGGKAADYDGSTGSSHTYNPELPPTTYSTELWFKTTTTSGGLLLGFGNSATDPSWSHDRKIWMDDAGRIHFGNYDGGVREVSSTTACNDGAWHHVATSTSPTSGTTLFLDGVKVGQTPGLANDVYSGHWRIGGDTVGGWPSSPTSTTFAGTIDEVAVFGKALDAATVHEHFLAARGTRMAAVPFDPYGKAVRDGRPSLYWRLDEASGTTAADSSGLGDDGDLVGKGAWGAATTVAPGSSLALDGGAVVSRRTVTNPLSFSLEGWVKTTSATGGRILGFGDGATGTSTLYDRALWLDGAGRAHFGIYAGREVNITSPAALNDGAWHQVVASFDAQQGMALYVDGVKVATDPNTEAGSYTGRWRAGADNVWGGAGSNIGGQLDEVAVYDRAVSADEVAARYALKGYQASVNKLPTASFTAATGGLSASVDGSASSDADGSISSLSWNFGDGTAAVSGAKVNHVYAADGTYTVTLTVTDDRGGKATSTQQVTVAKTAVAENAVAQDDFSGVTTGTWGSADAGGAWTVSRPASFSQDGARGVIAVGKGTDVKASLKATKATDVVATIDQSIDQLPLGGGGLYSRLHVRDQGTTSYASMLRWQANGALRLTVVRFVNGVQSGELGGIDLPGGYVPGQVMTVQLTATGTNPTVVTAAAWPKGGTAPAKPQITVKDSTAELQTAGGVSISSYLSGSSTVTPVKLSVDDLRVTSTDVAPTATPSATPVATPSVAPSATPTDSPSATPSEQTTPSATPTPTPDTMPTVSGTPVVTDAFEGTRSRWGSADLGGTYTYGSASAFSTAGGKGIMTVPKGVTARATLPGSLANVTVSGEMSFGALPSAGSLYTRLEGHASASDRLWAAVRLTSTGTMQLTISQVVAGVQTDLKTVDVPGTYTPGSVLRLDLTIDQAASAQALTATLYALGQSTPIASTSASSTASSLQQAGAVGASSYLSASATSPVVVSIDNLLVTKH